MAQFLTSLKKSTMQAGERRFAELLEKHLDDEYLVWYNAASPGISRRYPDFLLFHGGHGLWCVEIKDWHMGNIKGMTTDSVLLKQGEQDIRTVHPIEQARACCLPVIDRMKRDKYLRQVTGKHQGKLVFPWGFGAVMSNWQRARIKENTRQILEDCFPPQLTWYKEDIMEDALSRDEFIAKLHAMLPYHFPVALNKEQMARIRAHIYPEFIIGEQHELFDLEVTEKTPAEINFPEVVKVFDEKQENLARNLRGGHRVIHGVAGSGKTLILQYRARKLAEANPDKPILVVCFNVVLASILKSRLKLLKNIEVCHFHDWCKHMKENYGIKVRYGDGYPERLAEAICSSVESGKIPSGQYYAVLIDEGHDFSAEWLQALAKMPDAAEEHLLLLYDDAQTLYAQRRGLDFSLSSVGIKAPGRTQILRVDYRNSEEIHHYASQFIHHFLTDTEIKEENVFSPFEVEDGQEPGKQNYADSIPMIASESGGGRTGIQPEFINTANRNAEIAQIIARIQQWRAEGAAWGDMAVLYFAKWQGGALAKSLDEAGIPFTHPVKTDERKAYRPDPNYVLLCTMHSSKGGEFPCVIVSGVNGLPDKEDKQQEMARLLYVGMTRAQTHLLLTAAGENTYTRLLAQQQTS